MFSARADCPVRKYLASNVPLRAVGEKIRRQEFNFLLRCIDRNSFFGCCVVYTKSLLRQLFTIVSVNNY